MIQFGLRVALSARHAERRLVILDSDALPSHKTQELQERLTGLGLANLVFIGNLKVLDFIGGRAGGFGLIVSLSPINSGRRKSAFGGSQFAECRHYEFAERDQVRVWFCHFSTSNCRRPLLSHPLLQLRHFASAARVDHGRSRRGVDAASDATSHRAHRPPHTGQTGRARVLCAVCVCVDHVCGHVCSCDPPSTTPFCSDVAPLLVAPPRSFVCSQLQALYRTRLERHAPVLAAYRASLLASIKPLPPLSASDAAAASTAAASSSASTTASTTASESAALDAAVSHSSVAAAAVASSSRTL